MVNLQLSDESHRLSLLAEVERAVTQLPELWEEMNAEERRHVLRQVIEYCYVEPTDFRKHRVRVKFHFLPEVVEELPASKSRMTGLFDDVAHLTPRELAYLTLRADGLTDSEIRDRWQVTTQALYSLRKSAMKRLQADTVEEVIHLAKGRIEKERDELPLEATGWHNGRPKSKGLRPRSEEALVRYMQDRDHQKVAQAMGIAPHSVKCLLWHARHTLGCDNVEDASEHYLELKGGRLPSYGERLPL